MFSVFRNARKSMGKAAAILSTLVLAACQPSGDGPATAPSDTVNVALLVPSGSGQASDQLLARSIENAARMAITDLGGVKIDLRVYPTSGQPAQASAAATQAVADGASVILGPVFAEEANAAGLAASQAGINVLSFSNNPAIAGANVFVLGPTFDNTARRLASYAVRTGKSQVMIVHDRNPQGEAGRAAIQNGVVSAGGRIVATGSYEFSQNGIVQAIPGIAAQAKSSGAQAVFLTADTAGALPLVTQLLSENGVSPAVTQYVGLTRWDIPAATLSLPGVQGGIFAMPDPALYAQYQARYQSTFGEQPHPVSAIAYDGIAAIGALAKQGRGMDRASLTQGAGFVGVNGVFRLLPNGTNERGLAIARIQNNAVTVIDPAPRSFGGAGF
ncbi:penicillin-binding protein activator [Rhodobacteraceae bacterium HSP-20]|uniref:Penicillin-binding protein activator n=1 Tax=Paragemmobacter amnigenus TaxID=2852097 RepID=A0ABS6J810_9RHOB|nr:penicillin-binding protein activator [Rhodobacter amnigenus]MBU9699890.1 penicillin-binding protein activator [Rhodobacter amnigenus]MBV4391117.1 penicillin-binding protein activator [Rhodobacter amnigenus]